MGSAKKVHSSLKKIRETINTISTVRRRKPENNPQTVGSVKVRVRNPSCAIADPTKSKVNLKKKQSTLKP